MNKFASIIWGFFKKFDYFMLVVCIPISTFSCVLLDSMVYNEILSSSSVFKTQLQASIIGIALCVLVSAIDYKYYTKLWFLYTPPAVFLVALTFTSMGIEREGSDNKAWLDFFGLITFQPSEILKLAFILTFAYHLSKIGARLNNPFHLLLVLMHGAIPAGLIAMQGDDGSALVFIAIFAFMIIAAGLSWKYIAAACIALPAALVYLWYNILQPYQKDRILILFDPELDPLGVGLHQRYGKIALGSGMLHGKGLYGGTYTYVPEIHNDFIFSYIGMTLGFIGCIAVVSALAVLCLKFLWNSRLAKDSQGKLICIGVFAMFFFHSVVNIGMVIGVMPVIGLPLPLVSAGGTSIVMFYISAGIVMSVFSHRTKAKHMFYTE